ncbi:MAG TPA: (deoxy)nucleoside triphosphate pyrophosphohydrolase [Bacteroidota bacterium]|nr:(deoxy)nucleoside triphosphate pyrophosphohydrolase [Bacteroidota bacterium]
MIQVAVGIIIRKNSTPDILLCQRRRSAPYPLKWEFPGGKVETGEHPEDCLHRELHEELGITAEIGDLYHQQEYVYPDKRKFDVSYYHVLKYSGTLVNRVFESYAWVPIPRLSQYDILEGNADVVKKLMHEPI